MSLARIKQLFAFGAILMMAVPAIVGLAANHDDTHADEAAIEATMMTLLRAFEARDAEPLREVYADDADWTNAFGTTLQGRDAIVEYLDGLFNDPNFAAGELVGPPEVSARPVGEGAVIVRVYQEIEGQRSAEGDTLPVRRNHSMRVLERQPDGAWLIVSELYMDARDEATYRNATGAGE